MENKQNNSKTSKTSCLSKEDEYRRINEELEARTAALVREADCILKGDDPEDSLKFLNAAFSEDIENELDGLQWSDSKSKSKTKKDESSEIDGNKSQKTKKIPGIRGKPGAAAENVAIPDEKAFMSDLHQRIADVAEHHLRDSGDMESHMNRGDNATTSKDDVLPGVAAEMGLEAQNRFLKAKLRVLQEECDKITNEYNKKIEEVNQLMTRVKEVEEERNRLNRTSTTQQTQIEKYKKIADDSKAKSDRQEAELQVLKKELDSTKRNLDQQGSSQKTQNVRLNRALEDVDRLNKELAKTKATAKEAGDADRKRVEQLLTDNKRLEKQKNEVIVGFKKQMKLIDVLKRQRMHIEAAKMLQFAEEDFIKALDWSS